MNIDLTKLITAEDKFTEAREAKYAAVNALRDRKETEGFPYLDKVFQSDERSAARIFGAVQAAQAALGAGQPFQIDWATADNSVVTMDAYQTIGMVVAMATQANALHQYARGLKEQIIQAQIREDLDQIDIEVGWPAG